MILRIFKGLVKTMLRCLDSKLVLFLSVKRFKICFQPCTHALDFISGSLGSLEAFVT